MVIRLGALALVLVVGGSVFAGIPLHSNEKECNMPEMAGMDCCKKAAQVGTITGGFQPRGYAAPSVVRRVEPLVRAELNFRARVRANPFRFISHLSNPQFYHRSYHFVQGGQIAPLHIPIPLTFDTSHF